ncbi:MAG: aminotransferase class III-fold pyridoxal phosphate-dependent enzyme, partial [Pseudomonadota bacterium]
AGLAVLDEIEGRDLLANVRERGAELQSALEATFGQHPHVGDVRGRGLFRGIELVADRGTTACFAPSLGVAARLTQAAFARGLMVYPMGGTVDGRHGDHVLIAPPFILESGQIAEITEPLSDALDSVLEEALAA